MVSLTERMVRKGQLAQSVRVHASHAWGHWFESSIAHWKPQKKPCYTLLYSKAFFCVGMVTFIRMYQPKLCSKLTETEP